ncbi:MAG: ABC transporter permease [Gemmatimonadales bacterium]|nr:MAG: ABC transporter permease [Gemmatimonadales bacterium]
MTDLRSLVQLTLIRIRVMLREPEIIFWVFAFPILLAVGIGLAFSDPSPDQVEVVVVESPDAPRHAGLLEGREGMTVRILPEGEAVDALRRGEAAVLVRRLGTGVELQVDPARAEGRTGRILVDQALQEGAGAARPVEVGVREVEQRGQRYIDWLIPGIIGFNLMSTGLWGVGFYITQSRQNRQLKRLVATPMPRGHFLLAQILARFFFLVVEVPVLLLLAWWIFDVQLEGNPVALTAVVILGAACFSGLGLLVCSRVRTTEAVSGLINVLVMPMVVLSGVFFSTTRFPDAVQPLVAILPLTALNDALRHVYNDGLPLHQAAPELGILVAWTVGSFFLALRLFRWQ